MRLKQLGLIATSSGNIQLGSQKPPRGIAIFLSDEQGQATTEYILMLAMAVSLCLFVIKKFIRPAFEKLSSTLDKIIQRKLFGANLHQFRIH